MKYWRVITILGLSNFYSDKASNMYKLFLGFLLVATLVQCSNNDSRSSQQGFPEETANASLSFIETVRATYDSFGIDITEFKVKDFRVQKNESLYLLLQKMNLNQAQIYQATQKAKEVIDVRSFKPEQTYRAYLSKADSSLEKMVWEPNEVEFVTFDWQQDSLQIYRASRVVTTKTKKISGEITSSLYHAISDEKSRDELVYKMSKIFAWQVDFFSLRKGDSFEILFENKFVEDQFFDVGDILAVELTHRGEPFFAYKFTKGGLDGYYDDEGKSVQKALLKAPFTYDHRISSVFNPNRFHPVLKRRRPHNGVDYAAPYGTPVLSVGSGTVSRAGRYGAAGRMVEVKYAASFKAKYMHLSKFAKGVRSGTRVKQGDVIGYVGNSGRVTGTHLHYGLYKNSRPINPLKVDLPAAKAIPEKYVNEFNGLRKNLNIRLLEQESLGTTVPVTE